MNNRKRKKIGSWLDYEIGFSGVGPTHIDNKPKRKLSPKEKYHIMKPHIRKMVEEEKNSDGTTGEKPVLKFLGKIRMMIMMNL
jgi:hypothetical protein